MNDIVGEKIEMYINTIKKSLKNENCTSALAVSLMIPDVCSQLEYHDI